MKYFIIGFLVGGTLLGTILWGVLEHPTVETSTAELAVENQRSQNRLAEAESRRKTMVLKEEIEKQCSLVNQEILDKENLSAGEYIGIKVGMSLLGF